MSHTPTPWTCQLATVYALGPDGFNRMSFLVDYYTRQGGTAEEARANAAFIVRAVNSHDALVAACEAALFQMKQIGEPSITDFTVICEIEKALEAAK